MFSRRTSWETSPNRLFQALSARTDYIDLTVTNPGKVGLGPGDDELRALLADVPLARYEPDPQGLPAAREAIARHHSVDPAHVLVTASTSESYAQLIKLLEFRGALRQARRVGFDLGPALTVGGDPGERDGLLLWPLLRRRRTRRRRSGVAIVRTSRSRWSPSPVSFSCWRKSERPQTSSTHCGKGENEGARRERKRQE